MLPTSLKRGLALAALTLGCSAFAQAEMTFFITSTGMG